jgi:integrase
VSRGPSGLPPGIDRLPSGGYRARAAFRGSRAARTFRSLAAAVRWRADALDALRSGTELPGSTLPPAPVVAGATVEEVCRALGRGIRAGVVRSRAGTLYKPSVSRRMESSLRVHVLPRIGALPVETLSRRLLQRLVDELAAEHSPEVARKALHALSAALRMAERDGLLDANPCLGVRVPTDGLGERPVRVLTPTEVEALVAAAEADDRRLGRSLGGPLLALAFGSGLRSGELLALVWGPDGLDLESAVVRVRRSLDRVRGADGAFALVPPKTRAAVRDVPLDPSDVAVLRRHRQASGATPDGSLVFSFRGGPLDATGNLRHLWARAVRGAEVPPPAPRLHDARHFWAVAMLRAGVRPEAVARLGGWSDVGMVTRRYGRHALPDELAEAGRLLGAWRTSRRRS